MDTPIANEGEMETRLRLLEEEVATYKLERCKCYRVEADILGSRKIPLYVNRVYALADENDGFYTELGLVAGISYDGNKLQINIAFESLKEARQFVREVKGIVSSGYRVEVTAKFSEIHQKCGVENVIVKDDCPRKMR